MTILIPGGLSMNLGTIVLVGCVLGTGAIVYQGTMAGAAPANPATATSTVHAESTATPYATVVIEPTVLARAGATSPTPSPTAPGKLTLEQVRGLARPPSTSVPLSPPFRSGGAPAPAAPTAPVSTTPVNESGQSPTTTVTPQPPVTPAATPSPEPPRIATPPPLPPVPERPAPGPLPTEAPY